MLQSTVIVRISDGVSTHRLSRHLDLPTLPFVGMQLDWSLSQIRQKEEYNSLSKKAYLPVNLLDIRRVVYSVYGQALTLYGSWPVSSSEYLAPTVELYKRFLAFTNLVRIRE